MRKELPNDFSSSNHGHYAPVLDAGRGASPPRAPEVKSPPFFPLARRGLPCAALRAPRSFLQSPRFFSALSILLRRRRRPVSMPTRPRHPTRSAYFLNKGSRGFKVRFRVVALDTAVKMVEDSVDVLILNPRGVLVRRWLSRQCREGPVTLEFPLSSEPEYGEWTIRVEATNSFTEHSFTVEEFHRPRFEVEVRVPSFLSADANYLEGVVVANYSSGAPISGNVTVRAAVRPVGRQPYAKYGPGAS
ncbi:hypothetical protein C7M84_022337 [Penaeus vannamei]|uniref:Uncharacterized protein n=1 Tax=Penaeus vannamei TaxID=6689 RepID=A0A3R7MS47_PENVA|nr:hypothetical protein C7M84_022337 [Penaeus vannamei]